jgi:hypothetical protein
MEEASEAVIARTFETGKLVSQVATHTNLYGVAGTRTYWVTYGLCSL